MIHQMQMVSFKLQFHTEGGNIVLNFLSFSQVETGKLLKARSKGISHHTHLAAFSLVHQSRVVLMIHPVSRQWWGDLSTSVKETLRSHK